MQRRRLRFRRACSCPQRLLLPPRLVLVVSTDAAEWALPVPTVVDILHGLLNPLESCKRQDDVILVPRCAELWTTPASTRQLAVVDVSDTLAITAMSGSDPSQAAPESSRSVSRQAPQATQSARYTGVIERTARAPLQLAVADVTQLQQQLMLHEQARNDCEAPLTLLRRYLQAIKDDVEQGFAGGMFDRVAAAAARARAVSASHVTRRRTPRQLQDRQSVSRFCCCASPHCSACMFM